MAGLVVAAFALSLTFHANLLKVLFASVAVHYVGFGLLIATGYWAVCNKYLNTTT